MLTNLLTGFFILMLVATVALVWRAVDGHRLIVWACGDEGGPLRAGRTIAMFFVLLAGFVATLFAGSWVQSARKPEVRANCEAAFSAEHCERIYGPVRG
jgi:hypothetical protein